MTAQGRQDSAVEEDLFKAFAFLMKKLPRRRELKRTVKHGVQEWSFVSGINVAVVV